MRVVGSKRLGVSERDQTCLTLLEGVMEANRLTEAPGGGGTGGLVVESPSGTHFRGLFSGGRVAGGVCVCVCVHI